MKFEKVVFEFHIKCPMFIGEQWLRHRMGSFNKISGRYSEMKDEFYVADPLRKQSNTNKQGSSEDVVEFLTESFGDGKVFQSNLAQQVLKNHHKEIYSWYEDMLDLGVAKELARGVLPANLYTEFYWTVNLRSLFNFLELRLDHHAQYEIRVFAEAVFKLVQENTDLKFALEAFQDYVLDDPRLTKYEIDCLRNLIDDLGSALGTPSKQIAEQLQAKIQYSEHMSKREKTESKLAQLLFGDNK